MDKAESRGLALRTVTIPMSEHEHLKKQAGRNEELEKKIKALSERSDQSDRSRHQLEEEFELFLLNTLTIHDDFKRGWQAAQQGVGYQEIVEGLELISREMWRLLALSGIREIEVTEDGYNPEIHMVLDNEHVKAGPGAPINRILRPGYMRGQKILRKAVVSLMPAR
ncbi:nucleotide exchange factor GrpE [Acidobacteriota bacterium]